MPEKQIDVQIIALMSIMSFLGSLAKALSDETKLSWFNFFVQTFIGGISGLIFGFLSCWLIGENVYAVGAVSGIGAVLGINGLKLLSSLLVNYIKNKVNL